LYTKLLLKNIIIFKLCYFSNIFPTYVILGKSLPNYIIFQKNPWSSDHTCPATTCMKCWWVNIQQAIFHFGSCHLKFVTDCFDVSKKLQCDPSIFKDLIKSNRVPISPSFFNVFLVSFPLDFNTRDNVQWECLN